MTTSEYQVSGMSCGQGIMPEMTGTPTPVSTIELEIAGMTCASCAVRVEKKLNNLDGVNATVNYATEKATRHRPLRV